MVGMRKTSSNEMSAIHASLDEEAHLGHRERKSIWQYLNEDVDPLESVGPLAAYSFMTGYLDAICFSAIFVWCGFQTGNFCQLALAIARLFEGSKGLQDHTFHLADQQALCSLLTFQLGATVGRLGDRIGNHKRIWLISGTFLQALLSMAAAICIWKSKSESFAGTREEPGWTNTLSFVTLGFMSASLGVQGILAKRLNTQFGTSIVLTTVWVELVSDPDLFNIRKKFVSRDHKIIFASSLFLGGFAGRAILHRVGSAGTLAISVGMRIVIAVHWYFVKEKQPKPKPAISG